MAYEVIKTIGGRKYRYSVQSERDEASGKRRNRWTYIGRVASERRASTRPVARPNARARLLESLQSLLETGDAGAMTIDAIVAGAGVAHGTFYRYFRDRRAALQALAEHIKETRGVGDTRLLSSAPPTQTAARDDVRRWVLDRLRTAREMQVSLSVWYTLIGSDARLAAFREERRGALQQRLREHILILDGLGYSTVSDAAATAAVLLALLDGVVRSTILEGHPLDDARIEATAEVIERALFGGRAGDVAAVLQVPSRARPA